MSWSLIAHLAAQSSTNSTFTSSSIDTTGADTLFVEVSWYDGAGGGAVLTDSKSNTWTALTARTNTSQSTSRSQMYYAQNATVGSGHTFTLTGTTSFPSFAMAAFSGGDLSAPYDSGFGEIVGYADGPATITLSSTTPTNDNSLIISSIQDQDGTNTVSVTQVTITDYNPRVANSLGSGLAYLIQTSKAASSPVWSNFNSGNSYTATQQAFIAAAGGGGGATVSSQMVKQLYVMP
jgi:hypothetical protein